MSKGTVLLDSIVLTDEERVLIWESLGTEWKRQLDELSLAMNNPEVTPEETAAMRKRCGTLRGLQKKVAV